MTARQLEFQIHFIELFETQFTSDAFHGEQDSLSLFNALTSVSIYFYFRQLLHHPFLIFIDLQTNKLYKVIH